MAASYDERLRARVRGGEPDAIQAALVLMERHDPGSLKQSLELIQADGEVSRPCFDAVAEAWDHYFHMRGMSWD